MPGACSSRGTKPARKRQAVAKEPKSRKKIPGPEKIRLRELGQALQRARREHDLLARSSQTTRKAYDNALEEYGVLNAELTSTNEACLTSNQRLTSSNQELEATRNQLKAANAELNLVNIQLRERLAELTRAQEEIQHQASFPLLNPRPILELDQAGKMVFCNQAARDTLRHLGLADLALFNPPDLKQLLKNARSGGADAYWREVTIGDRLFSEFVQCVPQFGTIRIYASDVTEERRAHSALQTSESQFRSVFEHSQDVIYRLNLQTGRYEYMSPAVRALAKFEPEEMMVMGNAGILNRVHPEDQEALKQALARLPEAGQVQVDYRFRCKDDQYIWWSNYLVLLKDETGRPLYRDGFVRNVTENKQVEAALRASEARYRALFSGMTEGFALHEIICNEAGEPVDFRFLDINPAFETLTGLKREDVIGKTHNQILPNDSQLRVREYGRVALTGQPASFDNYSPELKRHFEVFAYCPAAGHFAVIFLDITERKQNESIRSRLVAKLQEVVTETEQQRTELEAIFAAHNDPVLIYDLQRKVQRVNPAFQAIFGFDPARMQMEELIPRLNSRLYDGVQLDLEKQPTPAVLRGEAPGSQMFLVQAADGQEKVMETTARPMLQGRRIIGSVTVMHDVTARVRAEEALRHSEERYRRLVEQSPDAVFINRHNRVEYLNQAALNLFGANTPEQVLGKSPFELFHPNYHAVMQERLGKLLAGAPVPLIQETVVRLDGESREAEVAASPFTDREGMAIQVILRDVTDRKKKENELHRLNWILNALSDSSQALMHAQEESAYLDEVCRIVVEDCGHSLVWVGYAEDNAGRTIRPVAKSGFEDGYLETLQVTWADTDRGQGPTGMAVRTGKLAQCRNMLTNPKFLPWREEAVKRGYASSLAIPLASAGKVFGVITIYAREPEAFTDDEIKLMAKLADNLAYGITAIRLRQARAKAEEEFRTLAENSPDGISRLDTGMKHLYINPAGRELLGEDITGKTWREAGLPADFVSLWEEIFNKLLQTGTEQLIENKYQVTGEDKVRFLSSRLFPEKDSAGRVSSVLIIRRDITELQELTNGLAKLVAERTQELVQAQGEVERARRMADLGRLASTVAHEMRNPLAAIQMAAYNIEHKANNPLLQKHLQTINKKVIESDQIIQNLLNFSRIKKIGFESVDLSGLLEECLVTIMAKYADWKVQLEKDLVNSAPLTADPTQLGMVFTNLLDNAFQALPEKTGVIGVSLLPWEGHSWAVTIRDTGAGIPEEYLKRIFEPFFTTKSKGTGLGLAVCREIVELHRGEISLRSEVGHGTEFTVVLPREQQLEPERPGNGEEEAVNPI